jgi:hypothetical protein
MKQPLIIASILICSAAFGQNLVPNGTFDHQDSCLPGSLVSGYMVEPWIEWSSPDFFHPCNEESYSVPSNFFGFEEPLAGRGYVGIAGYVSTVLFREFVSVKLTDSLTQNIDYHASFHVSMSDSMWYATRNVGVLFTENEPPVDLPSLLSLTPQVRYAGGTFLAEKDGWTKIEGSFTAQGGERYLTIGNFDTDEETDTFFVQGGGVPPSHSEIFWSGAYYYIDAVSVIPDSVYLSIGKNEATEPFFNLFPNPASDVLTIECSDFIQSIAVFDMYGRLVHRADGRKQNHIVILIDDLIAGVYNIDVIDDTGQRLSKRILKK